MDEEQTPVEAAIPAEAEAPKVQGWITQLPKELRENPHLVKHQKMGDMLQDYLSLAEKAPRALYVPGKDSSDEERDAFLKKMGIPKDAAEYKLDEKALEGLGEDHAKALLDEVRKTAKGAGLTKTQATKVFGLLAGLAKGAADGQKAAEKQARESFDSRLVEAYQGDETKAQAAKNRLVSFMSKRVGNQELVKDMAAKGILYDPRYVQLFAAIEERMGDAPFIAGQAGQVPKAPKPGTQGHYSPQFEAEFGKRRA